MARSTKGNRSRPAQGNNTNKRLTKLAAGGDNVRTSGGPPPVANNKKRGYGS